MLCSIKIPYNFRVKTPFAPHSGGPRSTYDLTQQINIPIIIIMLALCIILSKNSLAVEKSKKQGCKWPKHLIPRKLGQGDKTFVFVIYCDRNNILQGIFTTTIDFVAWPPLQIMPDSTKRWPSDKVNRSCENAL